MNLMASYLMAADIKSKDLHAHMAREAVSLVFCMEKSRISYLKMLL